MHSQNLPVLPVRDNLDESIPFPFSQGFAVGRKGKDPCLDSMAPGTSFFFSEAHHRNFREGIYARGDLVIVNVRGIA